MSAVDAAALRSRIGHPVIDSDGHLVEFLPVVRDFVREEAGESVAARLDVVLRGAAAARGLDAAAKRAAGVYRTGWWALPARNTLDRATAMLPRLFHERLDSLGIDVAVLYPTYGLIVMAVDDEELRRALARACNRFYAESFAGLGDRLVPVGVIPCYTPDEALAELDHAVGRLGLKALMLGGLVLRHPPGREGDRTARWVDGLGLDSAHDYDPVWARCQELGVAPTFHSTGIGFGSRVSPDNYVANHVGNFAAGGEAICRSLVFGGVPRRFPSLRFAFQEGGVAWAASLYADILGHWEKRNRDALVHYDPARLDRSRLVELFHAYGSDRFRAGLDRLDDALAPLSDPADEFRDEFAASGITGPDDVAEIFSRQFFFGCEADDPMAALAFQREMHPFGITLPAVFASDIGHWDVPDARDVLPEAWELVERGVMTEDDFRAFAFEHPAALWSGCNPRFFEGTVVEDEVAALTAVPARRDPA